MLAIIFLSFYKALPSKRANKAVLTLNNNGTRTIIQLCKGNKLRQTRITNSTTSNKIHYKVINSLTSGQIHRWLRVAPLILMSLKCDKKKSMTKPEQRSNFRRLRIMKNMLKDYNNSMMLNKNRLSRKRKQLNGKLRRFKKKKRKSS